MAETNAQAETAPARTMPYVSFQTFLTFIEDLKTSGLPPQIDRSVLKRFSGGVGSQLIMGLKSLGLLDDQNKPTDRLKELVQAYGTEKFKPTLKGVIENAYSFLSSLDLTTATPTMFADAFKKHSSAKEDVLRKCRTFYLHAAKDVGIELGQRLNGQGKGPRAAPKTPGVKRSRPAKSRPSAGDGSTHEGHAQRKPPRHLGTTFEDKLLDKFPKFDPAWPDEIKKQWFEGFSALRKMGGVE